MTWDLISDEQRERRERRAGDWRLATAVELGVIHEEGDVDHEFMESFTKGEKGGNEKKGPQDS